MMNELKAYVQNSIAIAKIDATEKVGKGVGQAVVLLISVFLLFICVLFLSFAAAVYIATQTHEPMRGFLYVGLFYFFVFLLVLIFKGTIKKWILNKIIKAVYK